MSDDMSSSVRNEPRSHDPQRNWQGGQVSSAAFLPKSDVWSSGKDRFYALGCLLRGELAK
jgi:hypothetical protein